MNPSTPNSWELRFDWTLTVFHWVALGIGVLLSAVGEGAGTGRVVVAAVVSGGYVVTMQAIPRRTRAAPHTGEVLAVAGVVAILVAAGLTDGVSSPYLLLLAAPAFFAATFLGFREGMETAVLAVAGLVITGVVLEQDLTTSQFTQAAVLYLLIAITFSQARRILIEERTRSEELAAASAADRQRIERLEAAHGLLASLTELADASELNPVAVGEAALRDLALRGPTRGGEVVLTRDGSPVVVARRGDPGDPADAEIFEMTVAARPVGAIRLWPDGGTRLDRLGIEQALRPVALAFDNILLLQEIAGRAVHEERIRVARELHDEIGPALASLGLGIDLAVHQYDPDEDLARHLETVRRAITRLVENVRHTVADLREEPTSSLVELARRIASEFGAEGPALRIELDERRPPRPALMPNLGAILTELLRNAFDHAGAGTVTVSGSVDHTEGSFTVSDDGIGFTPDEVPDGRFGLIGLKERAAEIGAEVLIDAAPDRGARITVQWPR